MINASDTWKIIEAAYQNLGATDDDAIDPGTLEDYDYDTANDEAAYQIAGSHSTDIALLSAYARQGYLDDDEIWDAIGAACRRALEKVAEERWQEHQEELEDEDEDWDE